MSAAVSTGVVALVLQAHNQNGFHRQKAITPNLMKAIVEFSAIPLADTDVLSQGTGEINAAGAVTPARADDTANPPGSRWVATRAVPHTAIGQTHYAGAP